MLGKSIVGLVLALALQHTAAADDAAVVKEQLSKMFPPQLKFEVSESPMPGVFEVSLGRRTIYAFAKDGHLLLGDVYDTERGVNLGEEKQDKKMAEALESSPEEEMIVMGDTNSERYVTVFTDIDCPYCQKFHQEIGELDKGGLKVRYMMFPRAGIGSPGYKQAVSVWCADDQGKAMTTAKSGGKVEERTCDNPVADQYRLGQKIGISGTPTMVLDDGAVIPGYIPAKDLLAQAGLAEKKAAEAAN